MVLGVIAFAACGDDPMDADPETLVLSFAGLEPLTNGFHYEGWAIIGGAPVTTGKFNVDAGGALVDLTGAAIAGGSFDTGEDLSDATAIVITIEPMGDVDAVPASTHIVSGAVAGGSAGLSVGDGSALGNDFTDASGSYILATPTNGDATNENSGIWFLSLATGSPAEGLDLPVLPAGWEYEGWAVISGTPVTTGRFTATDVVDFSDPYSGTMAGPAFPGEDFLVNPPTGLTFPTDLALAGATAVISIEPEPDDSTAPFTLKPLVGPIAANATDHVTYSILTNLASFPTGTATIQ
jgi:hypothetical protein